MTSFEILSLIIQGVGLFFVSLSIFFAAISFKTSRAKHAHEKLLETHKYINQLNQNIRESIDKTVRIEAQKISPDDIDRDPELQFHVMNVLNNMEILSMASNCNIHDQAVIQRAMGAMMVQIYNRFNEYIDKKRKSSSPAFCLEFASLVQAIEHRFKERLHNKRNLTI